LDDPNGIYRYKSEAEWTVLITSTAAIRKCPKQTNRFTISIKTKIFQKFRTDLFDI